MLSYPASIPLSTRSLVWLADQIRTHVHAPTLAGGPPGREAGVGDPGRHPDPDRPGSPTRSPITTGTNAGTPSTPSSSPTPPDGCCGPARRYPGSVHDLTAARRHGIPRRLTRHAVAGLADKAYRAAGPTITVPFKGRHCPPTRKRSTAASPQPATRASAARRSSNAGRS